MIEFDGKNYEFKYNLKRVEMIENATKMPMLADLNRSGGMLGITSLKMYIAYGIKEEGSDVYIKPKQGFEMAEKMIEQLGYTAVCTEVLECLQRDCPFFFRTGS